MTKNGVTYLRVSDESQIENNSLKTQRDSCQTCADSRGTYVKKVFRDEGISAKHVNTRPALKELLGYCLDKKNKISEVIVYKIDRWTRNAEEGLAAESLLSVRGIELVSATEGIQNNPTGRFVKTVMMALAELDNNIKSDRVKDNMKTLFHKGVWCWKCPPGYKRPYKTKEENKGQVPIISKSLGPIVSEIFLEGASKIYSRQQLADNANARGFGDHYSRKADDKIIVAIVTNPFYYGMMYAKKWDAYQVGLHKPLVSEEVWSAAMYAVTGRKRKYIIQDNSLYPLKGCLKCSECGRYMTSSNPKGRSKSYRHYECGNSACRKVRISTDTAHAQFLAILQRMKPSPEIMRIFDNLVFNEWDETINKTLERRRVMEKRLQALQLQIDRISKSNSAGIYTDEEAREKADEIRKDIVVAKMEISDHKLATYDIQIVRNFTENFLTHFDSLWEKLDLPKKQALQNMVFPSGMLCDENKEIRTAEISLFFKLIQSLGEQKGENVTPLGFEPKLPG